MFYALAKGKIPANGFEVEHVIEDIESLNLRALQPDAANNPAPPLEVTALSCHTFARVVDRYELLPYGASVGENYGPILVAKTIPSPIRGKRIAVPGQYTTAYLVLKLYEPEFEPVFVPFDQIFSTLDQGKADFGLLIHEGQLTYGELGFRKVLDLGEWWYEKYRLPLPLGINAIRKDLSEETKSKFTELFRASIDYALSHRQEALGYALEFGRGMDARRGDRFVGMYVNEYALDLGEKGREALQLLLDLGWKKNLFPGPVKVQLFQGS